MCVTFPERATGPRLTTPWTSIVGDSRLGPHSVLVAAPIGTAGEQRSNISGRDAATPCGGDRALDRALVCAFHEALSLWRRSESTGHAASHTSIATTHSHATRSSTMINLSIADLSVRRARSRSSSRCFA